MPKHVARKAMSRRKKAAFDPNDFLTKIGRGRTLCSFKKKQTIFRQGDSAGDVFYLQSGNVKVTVLSSLGKEAVVAIIGPSNFFGEGCLTGQTKRISTATAISQCEVTKIPKKSIFHCLKNEPAFAELFVKYLLKRTVRVEEDLVDQLFNSSEKRLARLLLLLANFGNEGAAEPTLSKISQETLAEMIGTTRARVSHFMNKFRRLGLISYNGRIEVHRSLLSLVLHEKPAIRATKNSRKELI